MRPSGAMAFFVKCGPIEKVDERETVSESLTNYIESGLPLEQDLEDYLVNNLRTLQPGLMLMPKQETGGCRATRNSRKK